MIRSQSVNLYFGLFFHFFFVISLVQKGQSS